MKVNLKIVEKLVGFELPTVEELVRAVDTKLGKVENIIDISAKYKDAKIVKVVECEKHPNADRLSVCKIDAGSGELTQVVCGAPNAHAGMWAIWLPPESIVPSTFDGAEPFKLGARELRSVMSNGMLASAAELAIGDDHDGIIELTDQDLPEDTELSPGDSFAKTFGLDSVVIDIENKMFTHRPDLFGQIGVAREIYAILQPTPPADVHTEPNLITPDWLWYVPEIASGSGLEIKVFNDSPEYSPRFMAVAMSGIEVGESPMWLKCQLVAMGAKPINNIVDYTNYIMLMSAQPVHAYDYDKLADKTLGVRMAREGEKITLINDKAYELTPEDIVIVDGSGPVGLAGVMGGRDAEVTKDTKNIVLEVANFDMYTIRKTSMRHGLFTDAVTRFNKGQSPLQTDRVIKRLLNIIPGQQASDVYDLPVDENRRNQESVHGEVLVSVDAINSILGSRFTGKQIGNILRLTNFATFMADEGPNILSSTAPYWRTDIEMPEDIAEEVGRLYGFDKLPRELPLRSTRPVSKNPVVETKHLLRESFRRLGANEVLTYSFVHENIFKRAEQDASQAFRLSNALSPDLQYYRLTVLPSLLDKVHMNIKAGHDEFMLYEIGKGHNKKYHGYDDAGLPGEMNFVDAVYASKRPQAGAAYYHVRQMLEQLTRDLAAELVFKQITEPMDYPVTAPFDLERSSIVETTDGLFIGMIGELKSSVVRSFKLPEYTAAMTLGLEGLVKVATASQQTYRPLSRYPSVSQDVSLKVSGETSYSEVLDKVSSTIQGGDLDIQIEPVSIYQSDSDKDLKTISLRLTFTSYEKTLTDKDVAELVKKVEDLFSSK